LLEQASGLMAQLPPLSSHALDCLRRAGRVASAAREAGARLIVPGARVRDVCAAVEEEIGRRDASCAFPVQSSRNDVAAHYCPAPDDETRYAEGDLAKLDIGVHIDGWVVDTALTVNVGDLPRQRHFVDAAGAALEAAIAATAPDAEVRSISQAIESTIRGFGLQPVRSLCGHGVGRWQVHGPPPIPNAPDLAGGRLRPGAVIAIEPFVTDGPGVVSEHGEPQVFRLDPRREPAEGPDPEALAAVCAFRGLPFARRQLAAYAGPRLETLLDWLRQEGRLMCYAPLRETSGHSVAQAEHTVYVGPAGVEVLTR
jgi:methionyl aminopeptidase